MQNETGEAIIEDGDVWDGVDKDVMQDFDQPTDNSHVQPPSRGSPIKASFYETIILFAASW